MTEPTPTPNLLTLPPELLLIVMAHLPRSALIALKLTNKHLHQSTPTPLKPPHDPPNPATECERKALTRNLHERPERLRGRKQCIHCGILAPPRRFVADTPLCKWHQARLMRSAVPEFLETALKRRLGRLVGREMRALWVEVPRIYCAHEREVVAWDVPTCTCACDSCGHFAVPCLIRLSPIMDTPQLSTPTADGKYVSEEHWMPARSTWPAAMCPRDFLGEALIAYRKIVAVQRLERER